MTVGKGIYVGTDDDARMLNLSVDGELTRLPGFDTVEGRDTWYAGSAVVNGQIVGPPLGVRLMSATSDGTVVLANVHVGGIQRSTDGGVTWRPTIEVDSDVHEVRAHPSQPRIVIAASAIGLFISRDGGITWSVEQEGMHATYCTAVAFSGDIIFVAASQDHFAARGAVYRRPLDAQAPFVPVGAGLPRWTDGIVDTGCIAARDSELAIADKGGNLYICAGAEWAWSRCPDIIPAPSILLIV